MNTLRVACLQINSTPDLEDNLQKVEGYCKLARESKVQLLVTPENVCTMPIPATDLVYKETEHPGILKFKELAKTYQLSLVLGSLVIKDSLGKIYNRSYFINNLGEIIAYYDKIHLFNAKLSKEETYTEADKFSAGDKAVLVKTDHGAFGMTICYDLRFPNLYRELALQGAQCLLIPAAFTKTTGVAHWMPLLRVRAIENACYVFAPNQVGRHADGRETFGHSAIVSPWGEIIALMETEEGLIAADIDFNEPGNMRKKIPSLYSSVPYSIHVFQ